MEWIVGKVIGFVTNFSYLAVFLLLVACGMGLPLPEEVTLVASGYVAYIDGTNWGWMVLVCLLAILMGDLVTYYIGHHYGMRVFRSSFFRSLLTEAHLAKVRHWYQKYGAWTVFFSRFVAGIRFCSYFTAGTMHVPLLTFCIMDLMGGFVSVPISVWAGHYFGHNIGRGLFWVKRFNRTLALAAILVGLFVLLYRLRRRRLAAAAFPAAAGAQSPAGAVADGPAAPVEGTVVAGVPAAAQPFCGAAPAGSQPALDAGAAAPRGPDA